MHDTATQKPKVDFGKKFAWLGKLAESLRAGESFEITRLSKFKKLCEDRALTYFFLAGIAAALRDEAENGFPTDANEDYERDLLIDTADMAAKNALEFDSMDLEALSERLEIVARQQQDYRRVKSNKVRIIHNSDLLVMEDVLQCLLADETQLPDWVYRTVADYAQDYDPHYGRGLIPSSAPRVEKLLAALQAAQIRKLHGPPTGENKRDEEEIAEAIGRHTADHLKQLARLVKLENIPTRKAELVTAFVVYLRNSLPCWIELMDDRERLYLVEAAHGDGSVPPFMFEIKYNLVCPGPSRYGYYPYNYRFSPLDLVMMGGKLPGMGIPQGLARRLRPLLPAPPPFQLPTREEIPEHLEIIFEADGRAITRPLAEHASERVAPVELRRVLTLACAGKLKIKAADGRPTKATERLLAETLVGSDHALEPPDLKRGKLPWQTMPASIRAHALAVLAQQCGWCKASLDDKLEPTAEGLELLERFDPALLRDGLNRLLEDNAFDELNRISGIKGQTGMARMEMSPPAERRQAIARALRDCPAGVWMTVLDLYRFVVASGNAYSVSLDGLGLYIGHYEYGRLQGRDWGVELELQYLRAFLMESLATLGAIDIAHVAPHGLWPEFRAFRDHTELEYLGPYDGLEYVRINPLGAYFLGRQKEYEAPAESATEILRVLPTRDVVVQERHHFSPADVALLDSMARRSSEMVWRLDEARILSHLESGGAMSELTGYLERNGKGEIPDNVAHWLTEIEHRAAAVRGQEPATLIELRDEATALLVAHDNRAGKLCRHAGGRHIVVPGKHARSFRGALKSLGIIMPAGKSRQRD